MLELPSGARRRGQATAEDAREAREAQEAQEASRLVLPLTQAEGAVGRRAGRSGLSNQLLRKREGLFLQPLELELLTVERGQSSSWGRREPRS